MLADGKTQVIALEEHYLDFEVDETIGGRAGPREFLVEIGENRIADMDAAGIDIQVLSHCPSGVQVLEAEAAVAMSARVNDCLKEAVDARPDRFAAFANLPTPDPAAAAAELERCVGKLGFKGAMIHGLTNQRFPDEKEFWPIFERAAALDVPVYLHPAPPHPAVIDAYYKTYAEQYGTILGPGWGFTVEIATAGLRMVLSGIFEAYPNLQIILGHMGESLPFSLWRINHVLTTFGGGRNPLPFKEIFCDHVYITTSGNFSTPALICSIAEMGVERVLFSVDWPFIENAPGTEWAEDVPLGPEDRDKIMNGNAKRLLKM